MLVEKVAKLKPLQIMLYWIKEREAIRLKKKAGQPRPWTNDTILDTYKFCNVRRMDDRVSIWLIDNWYCPYFNHKNMVLACAMARFINLPSTLEKLGFPMKWEPSRMKKILREISDSGTNYLNCAYLVCGEAGTSKIISIVDNYLAPLAGVRLSDIDVNSMEATWNMIKRFRGLASFSAGQVVADLRWAVKGQWADKNTWAPIGPGSKRGMNRLHGRPVDAPLNQAKFLPMLQDFIGKCRKLIPEDINRRLEAIDYQNCLCEFDKYLRTLSGEGRPKQKYKERYV